ncbi:YbaK/EbsC family protein [Sporolactobacillus shoreicorticis]|uniref:Aminoacyl-tRNA deacylase n=1 Tax=Sporolactobacillus shoreicorticis TaxID=1923877 RepID=A0ABW5S3H9_9BACL|nr:YbaK/EbsC family protein [Sporolactobacillus shoreicorticis]MCO7126453.1 YbaK/EbsC family protein [Sporolactobacillus shoreicorticis]
MKISDMLSTTKYKYEIIQHDQPILTREDGSKYFGIDVGQTAPTLIIKTDKGFFALIISGSREKISFDQIARTLNCKHAKLASPKEVQKVTGFHVGSVALIGLHLPCLIDKSLFKFDYVYGGTGNATSTLKISPQALVELNSSVDFLDF